MSRLAFLLALIFRYADAANRSRRKGRPATISPTWRSMQRRRARSSSKLSRT